MNAAPRPFSHERMRPALPTPVRSRRRAGRLRATTVRLSLLEAEEQQGAGQAVWPAYPQGKGAAVLRVEAAVRGLHLRLEVVRQLIGVAYDDRLEPVGEQDAARRPL